MHASTPPLIIGAGPVGLGAALFLSRMNRVPRIIEMRAEPTPYSKALAINPRTLELLEPTGLTAEMLALGMPIVGARLHRREQLLAHLSFEGLHPKYPFMIALSQAASERLLLKAMEHAGGRLERGVKLADCRNGDDGQVHATLESTDGATRETVQCPWLLAADGAHSTVRQAMGIDFPGTAMSYPWHLADAPLRTALLPDHAHVFLQDDGVFLFMLRVVDPAMNDRPGHPVWRIISNRADPLSHLVQAEQTGEPVWTSTFKVSHRTAAMLSAGNIHLAGDAAHIHSPFGARGMNLGLEDAWVFSQLAAKDRLQDYHGLRHPVDRSVVRQVEFLTRTVAPETALRRFLRTTVFPNAIRVRFLRQRMKATLTGLDHDLPDLS